MAEAIAGLPLHVYRYRMDGGKERIAQHPLYYLLHNEPNPEMTSFVFRETLMSHLLLWGNAYAQVVRNGRGQAILSYHPFHKERGLRKPYFNVDIYNNYFHLGTLIGASHENLMASIKRACELLGVSRSAYYHHLRHPKGDVDICSFRRNLWNTLN